MLFLSTGYNLRIVVEPTDYTFGVGGKRKPVKGKSVQFRGKPGQVGRWDSEVAQREFGWSDEEREMVERFLFETQEFNAAPTRAVGRKPTIYLGPGQDVPAGVDVPDPEAPTQEPEPRCVALTASAELCKGKPIKGTDFCRAHTREPVSA